MSTDIKHQMVFDLVREGMPAYKAYQQVYQCSDETARTSAYRIFKSENAGMKQALLDAGIDSSYLAKKLQETIDDEKTRKDGLTLVHKIRGDFSPEKTEVTGSLTLTEHLKSRKAKLANEH